MPKQLLEINEFTPGIVNDETRQSNEGFVDILGLDPWSEDGILQINDRLEADTTTGMTTKPLSFTTFDSKIISGNDDEELWYNNTGTTWTFLNTNSNNGDNNDITVYMDYLIYSSNTRLGRSTNTTIAGGFTDSPTWGSGSTFSNGTSSDDHFFKIFNNRLYITDGNFLAELDGTSAPGTPGSWVFTAEKFTLPVGEKMLSLEIAGSYLAIGTDIGNFYLWDGASANASQIIKTSLGAITAIIQLENNLFVFAGVGGSVYRYTGSDLVPVIQIPNFNTNADTFVRKPAVRKYRNGIIFGIPDNGIYVFNRVKEGSSFGLVKYGNLNGGKTIDDDDGIIYAIYLTSPSSSVSSFVVGYRHSSANGIDRTNGSGRKYRMYEAGSGDTSAAPFFETFIYELRNNRGKTTKIQGVQGLFKETVESSTDRNNIEVEYRLNRDTAYTVLGDIGTDGEDIDEILRGIGERADKVQFRIKFGEKSTSGTGKRNTKLTSLKIF